MQFISLTIYLTK